ncbi:hypothetical protein WA026_005847 [Henosepilachna vigintioctopunctata]|uniref:Uncharacterized protein n=1 Tax=Henosepilachna vigintioctopunctata TaxID=420089 RepID=A0AAW1TWB0_9CUCU
MLSIRFGVLVQKMVLTVVQRNSFSNIALVCITCKFHVLVVLFLKYLSHSETEILEFISAEYSVKRQTLLSKWKERGRGVDYSKHKTKALANVLSSSFYIQFYINLKRKK